MRTMQAFVYDNVLQSREGGQIPINQVRIDSNTGRIILIAPNAKVDPTTGDFILTGHGDSRDITDTLTTDERTVLYQMAPAYQFNSLVPELQHGIQPYQWVLIGGALLLTTLLILKR